METKYDVVVFGGGTAGAIAAIQAGRAGARTLLVEKNAMPGGTMTLGAINAPAHFFAWGKQVIAGIGWELVRKTLEETGQPVPTPDFTLENPRPVHIRMDRTIFAILSEKAVIEAEVELLYHAMPAEVKYNGKFWDIEICTKTGKRMAQAKVVIDATGDANVVAMAGYDISRPELVQPASMNMHCSGYDLAKVDLPALKEAAAKAIAAGELKTTDISWRNEGPESFLRRHGANANHIRAPGAETSEGRTKVEVEAHQSLLRAYRFFRRQPGLENFQIEWTSPEVGIRETATIKGKKTVCVKDYEAGKVYDDAVCYSFYSIDEHLNDGLGINYRTLNKGVIPTIPRGAMLPSGSQFLIVAGRCLSSDREANSALRVECPCMAMGQAAGAMAAISSKTGTDPEKIPLEDIYSVLRKNGAIVPGDLDKVHK